MINMRMRSGLRWAALATLLALQPSAALAADCLGDGATCAIASGCPSVCCTGMAPRTVGNFLRCPESSAVFRETPSSSNDSAAWVPLSTAPAPTIAAAVASTSEASSPDEGDAAATLTSGSANDDNTAGQPANDVPAETAAPASSGTTSSVDAFQSTQGLSGSRGGAGASGTIFIAVGALAGCVLIVAAVMYKRKTTTTKDLEIPGSSYHGTNGSGLTPDNRSLDGMMDGGARGTNDSMKQLPVLSMAGRDGSSIARLSSPFGQNTARISSPAHRGGTNEDYAFDVEMGSRAGSSVQVAFVGASEQSTEFVPEDKGVVAL